MKEKEEFDLVSEYAFILPVTVIAEMLGIPASDRDKFKHWSNSLVESMEPGGMNMKGMMKANSANEELKEYLRPLVAQRRKDPKDDLISDLVHAEEEGEKLTEEELINNCVLLLVAGHETTVNLIANSAKSLLLHKDQLQLLKEDPGLIQKAIVEVLRYEGPVQLVRRLTHADLEFRGKKMKERDMLVLLLGSANRDPEIGRASCRERV